MRGFLTIRETDDISGDGEKPGREEWVLIKCYVDVPKGGVECAGGRNLMIRIARLDLRDRAKMMWGPHTITGPNFKIYIFFFFYFTLFYLFWFFIYFA